MPPSLIIVCGLPYSGKSAISSELAGELDDAVHIDVDALNAERGFGTGGDAVPMMEWSASYQLAYERAADLLRSGKTVIFDAGNYSRAQRDIVRAQARKAGAESAVVFVTLPEAACRDRWQASEEPMDALAFERAVDRFEEPTARELVVVYHPGMAASELIVGLRQVFGQ